MGRIDIIIPVYRGLAETRACLESVLAAKNSHESEIVVMNDASPEPAIGEYLDRLAGEERITLVKNASNLGFVATCNRAMELHPDRDIVLLNSDTVVADGWLDRMAACAASSTVTASVTPFSNNATLCSYPRLAVSNTVAPMQTGELAAIFATVNAERSVEIPTGVGFCMLMTRAAIDAIGMFDVDAFGRGYGEENDWCMRATAHGFTHLLCGDVFVYHKGEVSFGGDARPGRQNAQSVIDQRYPGYREQIAKHLEDDPARPLRRRVDLARLSVSKLPRVLFITHNWGGGTEKHVHDLARLLADSLEILVLKPHDEQSLSLRWLRDGEEFEAFFEDRRDPTALLELLRSIGISRVHLHHVHGLPAYVLELHTVLGAPLDITLHDYFPLTQQYHLGLGGVLQPSTGTPANDWGLNEEQWRTRMEILLRSAARVIAPSRDLATRMHSYLPDIRIEVLAHPELMPAAQIVPHKVLLLGGLTVEKGLRVLEACALDARERRLPLFFKLIGHTAEPIAKYPDVPLVIGGTYREEDLAQLIALERADAFLFPAQIPESYSYTLTAALRANLPIVASALGAFSERLAGVSYSHTVAWDAPAAVWNDALLRAIGTRGHVDASSDESGSDVKQDYANRYLCASSITARPPSVACEIPARTWYAPRVRANRKEYSLRQLFDVGVDAGHAPSAIELRRRTGIADDQLIEKTRQLADAEARQNALTRENEKLRADFASMRSRIESERDAARVAFNAVISSTCWRATGPLRSMVEWLRDLRANAGELWSAMRRLPRDLAIARQILMEEGFVALLSRVRTRFHQRAMHQPTIAATYAIASAIAPLALVSSSAPRYSLVIPVYGQHLLTFTCLKSIAETCGSMEIEVLVIDDCSPEPAIAALNQVSGIKVIRNESNVGFLASCNNGAARAQGEYVVILNNDIIVTGEWLKKMEAVFNRFPDTGVVGAKLIYPDGRLQEAGGIVWRDGSAWNAGRDDDPGKPEYNFVREVDYCSGACLLIKREFWNSLSGFDKAFAPAYYEDTDLAFRTRMAGKRVFYQPHAVVVHFEGQSSGTDLTQGAKRHQVSNQKAFADRWASVLASHRPNGMQPELERNRYTQKSILVIDACMLTPDQDSGSLRMFEILGIMRSMGYMVTFVASNLEFRLPYAADIQDLGVQVLHHPYVSSIARYLEQCGAGYDIVMLSRESIATQYLNVVRRHATRARVIFDTVDLHFLRAERHASLVDDAVLRAAARKTRERELALVAAADVTIVVSPIERDLLQQLVPRANVQIVSNIHVPMPGPKPFSERVGIIFIGGFRHPPNLDAVTWYAEDVMPILRSKRSGLITTVIGSNAPPALQRFAAPDFVVAGFVPDVAPYYGSARLSISPLRYGAGVKGKINLAMQYGVPVVATTVSVEGMALCNEENVLVADDPEAFANAVMRVYDDEALWNRLRKGGLDNIESQFSRGTAQRALQSVLGTAVASSSCISRAKIIGEDVVTTA